MTRNLGYRTNAMSWLTTTLHAPDAPDIVILQEVIPHRLVEIEDVYDVHAAPVTDGGRRSVIAVKRAAAIAAEPAPDVFTFLNSYAASIRLTGERDLLLASVHTSPRPYDGPPRGDLPVRTPCERVPWWSDALVADLAVHRGTPMIIAGDLNEARKWDETNPSHTCGHAFFERLEQLGFTDVTYRDWDREERPTRWGPDYQLDRVLASVAVAPSVRTTTLYPMLDLVSDHAEILFTIE